MKYNLSEVENALLILANDNEQVLKMINDLLLRNGFLCEKKGRRTMIDKYFDYKDNSLKNHKIELRIRSIEEGASKITLKVLKKVTPSHSERVEIERAWSRESFDEIMKELSSYLGGHAFKRSGYYGNEDPENILTSAKFRKIQERKTERNIINAVNSQPSELEFEFAIDRIFYHLSPAYNNYGLMELEIESKKTGNYEILDRLVNQLITDHESIFRLWPHSKLATGLVIEAMLSSRELKAAEDFDNDGILTLSGAKKIESFIKTNPI
jgi:CYTH domain-containing protein